MLATGRTVGSSLIGGRSAVPYITSWSEEQKLPAEIVMRSSMGIGFGIAYADENSTDRDRDGILWTRRNLRHGHGRPQFGKIHSLRQRRAMRRLLCQVCAQPADRNEDGVLWLLPDYYQEAEGWPENYDLAEPPICLACVRSRRGCVLPCARGTWPSVPVVPRSAGSGGWSISRHVRRRSCCGSTSSVPTTRPSSGPWPINCCGHSRTAPPSISANTTHAGVGHDRHRCP